MKSRLAILCMLVFGMLLSTAGAGLAVSGLADQNDASTAQYGTDTPPGGGEVLGQRAVARPVREEAEQTLRLGLVEPLELVIAHFPRHLQSGIGVLVRSSE